MALSAAKLTSSMKPLRTMKAPNETSNPSYELASTMSDDPKTINVTDKYPYFSEENIDKNQVSTQFSSHKLDDEQIQPQYLDIWNTTQKLLKNFSNQTAKYPSFPLDIINKINKIKECLIRDQNLYETASTLQDENVFKCKQFEVYSILNNSTVPQNLNNYIKRLINNEHFYEFLSQTQSQRDRIKLLFSNITFLSHLYAVLNKTNEVEKTLLKFATRQNNLHYKTSYNKTNESISINANTSVTITTSFANETIIFIQEVKEFLKNLTWILSSPTELEYVSFKSWRNLDMHEYAPWRKTREYEMLRYTVDPIVYSVILVVGMLGNGMLLMLFIRHRELRTSANVMIINLAICDILNLSINGPLHLVFHYENGSESNISACRMVLAVRQFLRFKSALAVIGLITQRFSLIIPSFRKSSQIYSPAINFIVPCLTCLWLLPVTVAYASISSSNFYEPVCYVDKRDESVSYVVILNSVLYCALLPLVMFIFCYLIARRLKLSAKHMPGEIRQRIQEQTRNRSARVMMALAVVFVFTYSPFHLWVALVRWARFDEAKPAMVVSLYITKYLLFANGCFNPIALFIVSTTFRKLFVRYMYSFCKPKLYITKC
ncbi:neuromedin-B receptor-like isoform X2 [Periplaneta americana]